MTRNQPRTSTERVCFALLIILAIGLGGRRITYEASGMLGGDMARYLMNGVFVHDYLGSGEPWTFHGLSEFAEKYYARYPALSLGHHPPLLFLVLVPFLAIFGVGIFAARIVALMFLVSATISLYAIARRYFGWHTAFWTGAFFLTNVWVVRYGQYLLSEMPMIALVLAAMTKLLTYCDTRRTRDFAWFILAASASVYAKQLAVFVFPVFGVVLLSEVGWRGLLKPRIIGLTLLGGILIAPMAAMTVLFSPANMGFASDNVNRLASGQRRVSAIQIAHAIVRSQIWLPTIYLVVSGWLVLAWRRHRAFWPLTCWLAMTLGGSIVFGGNSEPDRYAFAALPAYFLLAASLVHTVVWPRWRMVAVASIAAAVAWQAWRVHTVVPTGAVGYEAAAEFAASTAPPVVLFDSSLDTGYFIFFLRKHDPEGRHIVVRADKLLTTAAVGEAGPGSRIQTQDELYPFLNQLGIRFVIVEERSSGPLALQLLHAALGSDRFIERQRIPIVSRVVRRPANLVIYEYKNAQPADLDAELDFQLPKASRELKFRLKDLVAGGVAR